MSDIVKLENQLTLERCPHCNVAKRLLSLAWQTETKAHSGANSRDWRVYKCVTCGGLVTCASIAGTGLIMTESYPEARQIGPAIPDMARAYLSQAINSLHAPAGAVMLAASAVDAMLKAKGKRKGTLNSRIEAAAADHLITQEMAAWAHDVRLDANEQRHADEDEPLPDERDAKKCIDFALALGDFLFVLPARVERGRNEAGAKPA